MNITIEDILFQNGQLFKYNLRVKKDDITIIIAGESLITIPVCNQFINAIEDGRKISAKVNISSVTKSYIKYDKKLYIYGHDSVIKLDPDNSINFFKSIIQLLNNPIPADA